MKKWKKFSALKYVLNPSLICISFVTFIVKVPVEESIDVIELKI